MASVGEVLRALAQEFFTRDPVKLAALLRERYPAYELPLRLIRKAIDELDPLQVTRPTTRKPIAAHIEANAKDEQQQADLVDYRNISKVNRGYAYILTVIDVYSRFAWAIPMKKKDNSSVLDAYEKVPVCQTLQTDAGSEFISRPFRALLAKRGTTLRIAEVGDKYTMGLIERFNRTLNDKIRLSIQFNGNNYIDYLPEIMTAYNNQLHSTLQDTPANIYERGEIPTYHHKNKLHPLPDFKVGDLVRHQLKRGLFSKRQTTYSKEIQAITAINNTRATTSDGVTRDIRTLARAKGPNPEEKPEEKPASEADQPLTIDEVRKESVRSDRLRALDIDPNAVQAGKRVRKPNIKYL